MVDLGKAMAGLGLFIAAAGACLVFAARLGLQPATTFRK